MVISYLISHYFQDSGKFKKSTLTITWYRAVLNKVPSGKRLHDYGKIHHFLMENSLFLCPLSMAMLIITRGYDKRISRWRFGQTFKIPTPHGVSLGGIPGKQDSAEKNHHLFSRTLFPLSAWDIQKSRFVDRLTTTSSHPSSGFSIAISFLSLSLSSSDWLLFTISYYI